MKSYFEYEVTLFSAACENNQQANKYINTLIFRLRSHLSDYQNMPIEYQNMPIEYQSIPIDYRCIPILSTLYNHFLSFCESHCPPQKKPQVTSISNDSIDPIAGMRERRSQLKQKGIELSPSGLLSPAPSSIDLLSPAPSSVCLTNPGSANPLSNPPSVSAAQSPPMDFDS